MPQPSLTPLAINTHLSLTLLPSFNPHLPFTHLTQTYAREKVHLKNPPASPVKKSPRRVLLNQFYFPLPSLNIDFPYALIVDNRLDDEVTKL